MSINNKNERRIIIREEKKNWCPLDSFVQAIIVNNKANHLTEPNHQSQSTKNLSQSCYLFLVFFFSVHFAQYFVRITSNVEYSFEHFLHSSSSYPRHSNTACILHARCSYYTNHENRKSIISVLTYRRLGDVPFIVVHNIFRRNE